MNLLKNIFFLVEGIIVTPRKTFKHLNQNHPVKEVVIIYITGICLFIMSFLWRYFSNMQVFVFILKQQIFKFTIDFLVLLLMVFLADFLAKNLKAKANFKGLLFSLMALIGTLAILMAFIMLLPNIPPYTKKLLPRALLGFWGAFLMYIVVCEIYNLSQIKTLSIFAVLLIITAVNNCILAHIF